MFRGLNKPAVCGYGETLEQFAWNRFVTADLFAPNCTSQRMEHEQSLFSNP
jgi:hypothetical protein